jgi:hypothetical protein
MNAKFSGGPKETAISAIGGVATISTFGLPDYTREQLAEVAKSQTAVGHDKLKMVVARAGSVAEATAGAIAS